MHPEIRRWVRDQGWSGLRELQIRAIGKLFDTDDDLIISASTAAGKTEAAFLPALTHAAERVGPGLSILYVSPLKALINDQFRRLEQICEKLEMPIVRWHGDASASQKHRMLAKPSGVALITPESIEALFLRRPAEVRKLLGNLAFIIVDELHAFLGSPRGVHLASLLKRIDALGAKPARRLALSATIGDIDAARAWLRPNHPDGVDIVTGTAGDKELKLQIRGYLEPSAVSSGAAAASGPQDDEEDESSTFAGITDHLFRTLRGSNNLIFAGSRQSVEVIADGLRRRCEAEVVPNEFFPHHGSLSREPRETLERRLLAGEPPTTAVCTSTLELGVDIGSVTAVAQIGAPRSLSGLRQRLGRCGRRVGSPATLRIYVTERTLDARSGLIDRLRPSIARAVAAIELLLSGFVETPPLSSALSSGLLHQTLSIIVERGGARADAIFRMLSGPGPFQSATADDFTQILRNVSRAPLDLIEQAPDGVLMLGPGGEKLTSLREFYSLFTTSEEWRIVVDGSTLGAVPISTPVAVDMLVIFAGRRWRIAEIDERTKTLLVVSHKGGRPPKFDGQGHEQVADELVRQIKRVYESDEMPAFLDEIARDLLIEGRSAYRQLGLDRRNIFSEGDEGFVMLWRGSAVTSAFAVAFAGVGLRASVLDFGLSVDDADTDRLLSALRKIAEFTTEELRGLVSSVENLGTEKFDSFVPRSVLERKWIERNWNALISLPSVANALIRVA